MLLMQLKGVNNEQILCTVQYTVLFSKYIVLETLACLITFIYTGCVETISVHIFSCEATLGTWDICATALRALFTKASKSKRSPSYNSWTAFEYN